jgi:hypothetical protein
MIEYFVPPEGISNGVLFHNVNLPVEDAFKLFLHLHNIQQAPGSIGGKGYKNVNVAVGAKIIPQNGAEQRKLRNLPPPAEFRYLVLRQIYVMELHNEDFNTRGKKGKKISPRRVSFLFT